MKKQHFKSQFLVVLAPIFVVLLGCSCATAQTNSQRLTFEQAEYRVFSIPFSNDLASKLHFWANPDGTGSQEIQQQIADSCGNSYFLTNAGIFKQGPQFLEPQGLFIADGNELAPLNLEKQGKGNFFLSSNGVFYITARQVGILPTAAFDQAGINPIDAVQSGPMLVTSGQLNPLFNSSSANAYVRSGVGLSVDQGKQTIHFAFATKPVNLHTFARFFQEQLHANDALCLESAGCLFQMPHFPVDAVNYAIGTYIYFSNKKCIINRMK